MDRLADLALASLRSQIEAGVVAVQLFDSWVGTLAPVDYARFVLPATRRIFDGIADSGVPRIHFGVGTGELLTLMHQAGADVVGVDWRTPLDEARRRIGDDVALQGNLDPAVWLAPFDVVAQRTRDVLHANGGHPGHIFNLGHGVTPDIDPGVLTEIVALVHAEGRTDRTVSAAVAASHQAVEDAREA
jgi:uroporphyrinogen decarboxylase